MAEPKPSPRQYALKGRLYLDERRTYNGEALAAILNGAVVTWPAGIKVPVVVPPGMQITLESIEDL